MKKILLTAILLTATVTRMLACSMPATHNYYLFSLQEPKEWGSKQASLCMDNWRAYAGRNDIYDFDADELRRVAQQKGDALMMSYIGHLKKYLDVVEQTRETWDYPTKKEQLRRQQVLQTVQKYAFSKTRTRLRSQHALLYMRCCMMLGEHRTNVLFWEQTASKLMNSVYRDMMRNIYAGALLKTGRTGEATQIFMEQGDVASLYTYYYDKRSFEKIRQEYLSDPNAPALPFLIQDFANNAQEAYDLEHDEMNCAGKLFVRDIKKAEAMQMSAFAHEVLIEGRTKDPSMWQSLEAWLHFLFGDRSHALQTIRKAVAADGLQRSKDNARLLRLFIEAHETQPGRQLDDFLAAELDWLTTMMKQERAASPYYENHYTRAFDRLVHQVLMPGYAHAGRTAESVAFLAAYDEMPNLFAVSQGWQKGRVNAWGWNNDYSTEFFGYIDEAPVAQVEQYAAFINRQPATALERWLSAHVRHDNDFFNELIGTKYLRLCQWTKAEAYLSAVSLDFINTMNIVPFMARRNYRTEPWMNRQRIRQELQMPGDVRTRENQKLAFVCEMASLEQGLGTMLPEAKARRAYELAVRYAQASYGGDAWYLTRYGKSSTEQPRPDETDMLKKADELLTVAQSLDDFLWKEKVLFARAWLPFDSWYTYEWDDEVHDAVLKPQTRTHQYRSLYHLADFERQNATRTSEYVSRCDVLKQFLKSLRQE